MKKLVAAAVLSLCLVGWTSASGCYGSFLATRWVYDFNGKISENGAVQSIVMWAFAILPVYGLATFADAAIFNLIEFWTGSNPLKGMLGDAPKLSAVIEGDDHMTVARDDQVFSIDKIGPQTFEVREDGVVLGTFVVGSDGGLVVLDAQGRPLRAISAQELDAMRGHAQVLADATRAEG